MIDLETMSLKSTAAIVQIGAIFFDVETGERVGRPFEANVDLQDCIEKGMATDGSTIEFWLKQPKKGFLDGERLNLDIALQGLTDFVKTYKGEDFRVWAHAAFDGPILENAYSRTGQPLPFDYRQVMDVRTLFRVADHEPKKAENHNPHDALSDCVFQAKNVAFALKKFKERKAAPPVSPAI